MVNSKEILEITGLKNIKTLTRWYQKGIIPPPHVGTHPSGHGKIAYWQDWVLDFCVKIIDLRKLGYSTSEAALVLNYEKTREELEAIKKKPRVSEILAQKKVLLKGGRSVSLLDVFLVLIIDELKNLVTEKTIRNALATKFNQQNSLDLALEYLDAGFNPVLMFDGFNLGIYPDFVLSHLLSHKPAEGKSNVVLSLLKPLNRAYSLLGKEFKTGSLAYPTPKIRIRQGDVMVEYDLAFAGTNGFKLIRESAKTIGVAETEDKLGKKPK